MTAVAAARPVDHRSVRPVTSPFRPASPCGPGCIVPAARRVPWPVRAARIVGLIAVVCVAAVGATTTSFTGAGVTVAVLDTGIDAGHEAFAGKAIEQKDFTGEGDGDRNGHGTHCAGTIFGGKVGQLRIGVAPGIQKALIGKVLDAQGSGSTDQILDGLLWAVRNGANVVSMSIGFDFPGMVKRLIDEEGLEVEPADVGQPLDLGDFTLACGSGR